MHWKHAGIVGVDGLKNTWGELYLMARARISSSWDHTASLLSMTAEINRDKKKRSEEFTAKDFHPFSQAEDLPKASRSEKQMAKIAANRMNRLMDASPDQIEDIVRSMVN